MAQNVATKVDGKTLTITVDLSQDLGLSSSGKSKLVATTKGSLKVGDVMVGLNVFRPVPKA